MPQQHQQRPMPQQQQGIVPTPQHAVPQHLVPHEQIVPNLQQHQGIVPNPQYPVPQQQIVPNPQQRQEQQGQGQARLTAKTFAFYLQEAGDYLQARLDAWATVTCLDYLVYPAGQQYVLVLCKTNPLSQVALTHGAWTVKDKLGLGYVPVRIAPGSPFVENVLRLTTGAQAPFPVFYKGENFSAPALAGLLTKRGRLMNREHAMSGLVATGDLRVTDVGRIANARSMLHSEAINRAFAQKKDLEGPLPVVFYLYDNEGRRVAPGPTKKLGKPTTVVLHGLPGDLMSKKKHVWIYSKDGNRGECRQQLHIVS
jgi:hypothetical protein